jgi:hypothetical protein
MNLAIFHFESGQPWLQMAIVIPRQLQENSFIDCLCILTFLQGRAIWIIDLRKLFCEWSDQSSSPSILRAWRRRRNFYWTSLTFTCCVFGVELRCHRNLNFRKVYSVNTVFMHVYAELTLLSSWLVNNFHLQEAGCSDMPIWKIHFQHYYPVHEYRNVEVSTRASYTESVRFRF